MFSQASVILSTIGLMPTGSLLILVGYSVTCHGAVGMHPTGTLSCLQDFCFNPVNYGEFIGNLWDACPYKVRWLMHGRGVSI